MTTLTTLCRLKEKGEKIAMLTGYDASFAALMVEAGVDALLVGDSLGMAVQGRASTLAVTQAEMEYHVACVARGAPGAFIVADMAFGTCQTSPADAFANAARLLAAGAHMVKIEGGEVMAETVAFLVARGIPVCGHLGLTPQSVNQLGGYRVQGKSEADALRLLADARAIEAAGAAMLVLETIPAPLGKTVTEALSIPTIGIGAGPDCSGQVLVVHDMLGIYPGRTARFVKNFLAGQDGVQAALAAYVAEVKAGRFPAPEHCFS